MSKCGLREYGGNGDSHVCRWHSLLKLLCFWHPVSPKPNPLSSEVLHLSCDCCVSQESSFSGFTGLYQAREWLSRLPVNSVTGWFSGRCLSTSWCQHTYPNPEGLVLNPKPPSLSDMGLTTFVFHFLCKPLSRSSELMWGSPSGTNRSQARTSCSCLCIWSLSSRPAILLCAKCHSVACRARPMPRMCAGTWVWEAEDLCTLHLQSGSDSFCPSQFPLETSHSLFPPSHSEEYFLHFPWYFLVECIFF